MFEVGKRYKTIAGDTVEILSVNDPGIYCINGKVVENVSEYAYTDTINYTKEGSYWDKCDYQYSVDDPRNLVPVTLVEIKNCTSGNNNPTMPQDPRYVYNPIPEDVENSNPLLQLGPSKVEVKPVHIRPTDYVTDSLRYIINATEFLHQNERRAVVAFLMNLWEIEND